MKFLAIVMTTKDNKKKCGDRLFIDSIILRNAEYTPFSLCSVPIKTAEADLTTKGKQR